MKRSSLFVCAAPLLAACSSSSTTASAILTADAGSSSVDAGSATVEGGVDGGSDAVACGYSESTFNSSASVNATSTATWTCTSTTRNLTANGLPDHATGTFPNANCPNTISAQTVTASLPLTPANTGTSTSVAPSGYQLNGVKYDPGTAGGCTSPEDGGSVSCTLIGSSGPWNIEALGQSSFNFGVDSSNAHVQPNGAYHYHGMPEATLTLLNKGQTPTLVGFAVDGFPVYARYGYTSPMDATSAVKVIKGSYQLKTTPDEGRPSTTTYPLGAFSEDYEYVEGSGDLDKCNGRTDVTPEYPNGIYHYYITDTYPFIQRCVMGTASSTGQEGGGGGGGGGGAGGMMDAGTGATSDGAAACTSTSCSSGDVCCPSGQPCAGECVPNCNTGGDCPSGTTCDATLGICTP